VDHVEVEGTEPTPSQLLAVTSAYGHFTAMQVRQRSTRGLALHMGRLGSSNREAFDADFDPDRTRALIRHALGDAGDASVRVYIHRGDSGPITVVTVRPPAEMASPITLMSVAYLRPDPHIKHIHTDQGHYREAAQRAGFDDAVLTTPDGRMSETTMANIGFFDEAGVIWPDAPMLDGITKQLLESGAADHGHGVPMRDRPVRVSDLESLEGAFVSSARGIGRVTGIDDVKMDTPAERVDALADIYASTPWERI
jgi:branched-subunit amino acid aminotransferase/4-amino-4-deoxychorismate lyase